MGKRSGTFSRSVIVTLAVLTGTAAVWGVGGEDGDLSITKQAKFKHYDTKYYEICSDANIELVREAAIRMTSLFEEYHTRTTSFGLPPNRKLTFYFFASDADYDKATDMPKSAGVFTGEALASRATEKVLASGYIWHILQHEAFHQYVHHVIGGRMPVWANEGMAEYFSESIWTGDGLVTGIIPPWRLKQVQQGIQDKAFVPLQDLLTMTRQTWNERMLSSNYDQAWSTIHFLAHAEKEKYQKSLMAFIVDVSKGKQTEQAMVNHFGSNIKSFQETYNKWWLAQGPDASEDLYCQAMVQTLTSYLARGAYLKKKFPSVEAFFQAVRDGNSLQVDGNKAFNLWLPKSLADNVLENALKAGQWSFDTDNDNRLRLTRGNQIFTGSFELKGADHPVVKVVVSKKPTSKPAANDGKNGK